MHRFIQIIFILLLSVNFLHAFAFEKVISKDVTLQSEKVLVPGANTILLKISDTKYHDANVEVKFFMPAAPDMPYMETISHATYISNGLFRIKVNLSMSGKWYIHIFLQTKEGEKIKLETSLNI